MRPLCLPPKSTSEAETRNRLSGRGAKGDVGLKKKSKLSELNERYRVERRRLKTVIEEVKQRMLAKSASKKISAKSDISKELNNLDKMYAEFNEDGVKPNDALNAEESKIFWGDTRSVRKGHN